MQRLFDQYQPPHVINLAAESHFDRLIDSPSAVIKTNIMGTDTMFEVARHYVAQSQDDACDAFWFHHISTDEVYGDLVDIDALFTENTPYRPSSPYSASRVPSDHLVRSWHRIYGFQS